MKNLVDTLKLKNPHLKKAEIAGILYLIKTVPNLTNKDLIRATGLPKETLKKFKASIAHLLQDSKGNLVSLTTNKLNLVEDVKPYKWSLVSYSDEKAENTLRDIRKKYDLEPKREYDQFFATIQTSIAKAKILIDRGVVEGKHIALIGDDDLVSIVLGFTKANFKSLTVFDIDKSILETIEKISKDLGLENIKTRLYDARRSISPNMPSRFDVVMTDPPYTKSGINLFLQRAVELLGKAPAFDGKYIFLCYGNSFKSPNKTLKIQEIIGRFGLVIEDKIDKFNRYHGAESVGSTSSMYILKTTPSTTVPHGVSNLNIYTFEDQKEDKFPFVDHYTFKIMNVPGRILGSKKQLLKIMGEFCKSHHLKVIDTHVTKFKGQGISITFILANSNLVVHIWPEFGAVHIDLITCKPIYGKMRLQSSLCELFQTRVIETQYVE
jgi:N4-bis(aminopropyl)spermidine synthase